MYILLFSTLMQLLTVADQYLVERPLSIDFDNIFAQSGDENHSTNSAHMYELNHPEISNLQNINAMNEANRIAIDNSNIEDKPWTIPVEIAEFISPTPDLNKPIFFIDYACIGWAQYIEEVKDDGRVDRFNYVVVGAGADSKNTLFQTLWQVSSGAKIHEFYDQDSELGCQENCSTFETLTQKQNIDFEDDSKDVASRFLRLASNYQTLISLAKNDMRVHGISFDEENFRPSVPALYYNNRIFYPSSIKEIDEILGVNSDQAN